MGVSIHCGKLPSMDMSYSTFDRWRVQLAKSLDSNFGELYNDLIFCHETELYKVLSKQFEDKCNSMNNLTQGLFDFFMTSDCEGKIGKETSKQLIPLIEKLDDEYKIGYCGIMPYNKEYVLNFFRHSARYGANVWWS